jgi:hypothetical protein
MHHNGNKIKIIQKHANGNITGRLKFNNYLKLIFHKSFKKYFLYN